MQNDTEFWKYIDRLIEYTDISRDEVFDQCHDIYTSLNLTVTDLLQISINLKVDPVLLWQRNLDLDVLKEQRKANFILPSRYSDVKSSKIASLRNVLEQFKRYNLYEYALNRIQLTEEIMKENASISVLAINDLLTYSGDFFTEKDYIDIARRNSFFMFENTLKTEVSINNSSKEIATNLFELIQHFERNWEYKIVTSKLNSITIETLESDRMQSAKGYSSFTNHITTYGRFSFIKQALGYFAVDTYNVIQHSDWENPKKNFKFTVEFN